MDFAISIYVDCIKKASDLLFVCKISSKKLFNVLVSHVSVVFMINFEENFAEPIRLGLVNLTAICNDVLNALSE